MQHYEYELQKVCATSDELYKWREQTKQLWYQTISIWQAPPYVRFALFGCTLVNNITRKQGLIFTKRGIWLNGKRLLEQHEFCDFGLQNSERSSSSIFSTSVKHHY